jgi:hypothetical protein
MDDIAQLSGIIDAAFEERAVLTPQRHSRELALALDVASNSSTAAVCASPRRSTASGSSMSG